MCQTVEYTPLHKLFTLLILNHLMLIASINEKLCLVLSRKEKKNIQMKSICYYIDSIVTFDK